MPEIVELDGLHRNDWNPTGITPRKRAEIRRGLEVDGWLLAQALLVWRKDEKGRERNVIIDGEQRYTVARELGFTEGPVSYLDGLTESEAKALTIKLNARRAGGGDFDDARLSDVLKSLELDVDGAELAFDLGLDVDVLDRLTRPPEMPSASTSNAGTTRVEVKIRCPKCQHEFPRK